MKKQEKLSPSTYVALGLFLIVCTVLAAAHMQTEEDKVVVKDLHDELKQAEADENYELAAILRDKIKMLNSQTLHPTNH